MMCTVVYGINTKWSFLRAEWGVGHLLSGMNPNVWPIGLVGVYEYRSGVDRPHVKCHRVVRLKLLVPVVLSKYPRQVR